MGPIDRRTKVLDVPPDLSFKTWDSALREIGSPVVATGESRACYDLAVAWRVLPSYILGKFFRESEGGKKGAAVVTHSWGNTRQYYRNGSPVYFGGIVPVMEGGKPKLFERSPGSFFPVWQNWTDGLASTLARLMDRGYVYFGEGRDTPEEIIPLWAPKSDNNDPELYIRYVLDVANRLRAKEGTTVTRVALAAGHHNTSGGNEFEHETTGLLTPRVAAAMRARGFDVRVITPDEGRGDFPGALDTAAATVIKWSREGWAADLFVEIHTEGVGNPAVRGCFGIFPDRDPDVDVDARDKLIPLVIQRMGKVIGAVRGNGKMSEKETSVGLDGSRLGVFRATEPMRANLTRVIFECGTHTNPVERAIMRTERYLNGVAVAITEGAADFYGLPDSLPPVDDTTDEQPESTFFPETGKVLRGWFRDYWTAIKLGDQPAGLQVLGFPRTNEMNEDGTLVQYFDRGVLTLVPGGTNWYNGVIGRLVGYEEAIRRGHIIG